MPMMLLEGATLACLIFLAHLDTRRWPSALETKMGQSAACRRGNGVVIQTYFRC